MKSKKQKTLRLTKCKIVNLSLTLKLVGGDDHEIGQSLKTKVKRLCKSENIYYCNRPTTTTD